MKKKVMTPDDTIVSSYNTAKRIRMELQDQHKAEKQALKAAREARSSSASETEYPSMQLEISYLEASRRVSCNLYNHLAWLITDASPEVGDDGRTWHMEKTYNRDAKTKLFTGISQQPAAMEKYLRVLPVLTAVSEQTKAMAHLDMDDTKHHEDSNS
ncbi:hypothetical protein AAFF_G00232030 [Aldrovandia affinis]|uniref:Uncharacterized protein n=1 Tax=Aldrovandia affinis TaxID=143900 RepID=A0AAD7RHT5_9TELE|nr:hypothetical protein AAFF_G00232030 [Aldrovandia affinis]